MSRSNYQKQPGTNPLPSPQARQEGAPANPSQRDEQPTTRLNNRATLIGPIIVAVSALLAAAGSIVSWLAVKAPGFSSIPTLEANVFVTVVCSFLALGLSVLTLPLREVRSLKWALLPAAVPTLVNLITIVFDYALIEATGGFGELVGLGISLGWGLIVVTVFSLAAIVGAVAHFVMAPDYIPGSGFWSRLDVKASPYLYVAPFFIVFLITGLYPMLYTAWVAVHDWHLVKGDQGFVGLENFANVLGQPRFWQALGNTLSIFVLSMIPQVIAAIFIAAVLDANLRAKTLWRMGVLLPYVVTPIAVSLIFGKLFADQFGLVNAALTAVGWEPIGWHVDSFAAHFAISCMVNFRWTGYTTLIILAAMQAIPRDLYEAAIIDGASRVKRFFFVTIPMLRPTLIFVVLTSTIGGLQIFDEARGFNSSGDGGPDRQWMTLTMYLYEMGWGNTRDFGRAAAIAWLLFLLVIAFASINYLITRSISSDETKKRKVKA